MTEINATTSAQIAPIPASTEAADTLKRNRLRRWGALALLLILLGSFLLWFLTRNEESTDDAFIESNVVQISPHVGGYVAKVLVNDNQWVKQGEVLAEIDSRDYELRVEQAQAVLDAAKHRHGAEQQDLSVTTTVTQTGLDQARSALDAARSNEAQAQAQARAVEAQALLTQQDVTRYQALFQKDEISHQKLDQIMAADKTAQAQAQAAQRAVNAAQALVHQAEARVQEAHSGPRQVALKQAQVAGGAASIQEAQAALDQARLDLSYTHLIAPVEGRIARKNLFQGQLIQPGPPVMAIVYGLPWVVANFKETQLQRMHPGLAVKVKIDSFSGKVFRAHVDSIQPGTGARFSLLPPENASGNYVKVVQRIPVKILFDESPNVLEPLVPGMSVEPRVQLQ